MLAASEEPAPAAFRYQKPVTAGVSRTYVFVAILTERRPAMQALRLFKHEAILFTTQRGPIKNDDPDFLFCLDMTTWG